MRLTYLRLLGSVASRVLLLSGLVLALGLSPSGVAASEGHADGHVFVLNNSGWPLTAPARCAGSSSPMPPAGRPATGALTSYRLLDGKIRLIAGPMPDHQIAPCWMVVTRDGRFAYTSDADSQAISGHRFHTDGTISLLNANGVTGTTPSDTFPLEEGISRDSRFLYGLDSRLLLTPPGLATLSGFLIHHDGSLTPVVDPAKIVLPVSAIGLVAE